MKNIKTKVDPITGEKMYKSTCCGKWEYDITSEGICQPCFQEEFEIFEELYQTDSGKKHKKQSGGNY